nr:hypothetical protein [Tanacetum cinerariifolium]
MKSWNGRVVRVLWYGTGDITSLPSQENTLWIEASSKSLTRHGASSMLLCALSSKTNEKAPQGAGSRDRPPMLATGRYPQWQSRFLRCTDTRPNGDALRKCILSGHYKPTTVLVQAVARTDDSLAIPKHTTIAKPITPPFKSAFEEDNDPEQAQRDKDMQKNLALIAKYYKKIYKPTNKNLETSSNSRNKSVDTNPLYKNDNQPRQFGNKRTVNVAGARENVGSSIVQQSGIQSEQDVSLQAEQYDWLAETDEEIDEQELDAHYSYKAKIQELPTADTCTDSEPLEQVQNDIGYNVFANDLQHSEQSESISNTCLVETDDSNVIPYSPDMCDDVIQNDQNDVKSDDECVALANLIAN